MTQTPLESPEATSPRTDYGAALGKLGPFIGLVCVFLLFAALRPKTFLTAGNMELMLVQTAVVGTAALGMTLIIISGGIDLSVGATIALVTVLIAMLLAAGAPAVVVVIGGIAAGCACGVLIGTLVTFGRLLPFVVTLGTWGAYRGTAKGLANEQIVVAPPTWLNSLLQLVSKEHGFLFPIGVWLLIGLALLTAGLLRYTRFGRHIFAIGSNENTARLCGVRVERTKLMVYALAGALTGIAGVLQFSYLTVGDPTTANGYELNIIAAVVIGGASLSGGQGTILGAMIGALIMTIVSNGCTKLELANWVQEIVTGAIIILAVGIDQIRRRRA